MSEQTLLESSVYKTVSGSGPDLVLLHGWGTHGNIWNFLLPELTPLYTVHVIDLPGFGQSPMLDKKYHLDNLVEAVYKVMPDKSILLGWSLGGMIATAITCKHPEKISRLITVASNPSFVKTKINPFGMSENILKQFIQTLSIDQNATLKKFLTLQTLGSPTKKEDAKQLTKLLINSQPPQFLALLGGLNILKDTDLSNQIKRLNLPILRIYGKNDRLVDSKSGAQFDGLIPHSETQIFSQSGHLPFISQRQDFLNSLVTFIVDKHT